MGRRAAGDGNKERMDNMVLLQGESDEQVKDKVRSRRCERLEKGTMMERNGDRETATSAPA